MSSLTVKVHGQGVPSTAVTLNADATAWDLARTIEGLHQDTVPANRMRLLYLSKELPFNVKLSEHRITNNCVILIAKADGTLYEWSTDDAVPRFNFDFTNVDDTGRTFRRGLFDYSRPCGWKRFALACVGRYDNGDNTWLKTDDSAWPVAYFASGFNSKGESLRSVGYTASKALSQPPIDPPFGYFFAMNVNKVAPFATSCIIQNKSCLVVVQARVNPSKITLLSEDIWVAQSADAFRPYGVLVKGDVTTDQDVLLGALNSLLPYAEILPKKEYYERTAGGVERGHGKFSPDACVKLLSIGGHLYSGKVLAPMEKETFSLDWHDCVPHDLADAVLQNPCYDTEAECKRQGSKYILSGPRAAVTALATALLSAMDRFAPAGWTSTGMKSQLMLLATNDDDYKRVASRFSATMSPNAYRIVSVQRVENRLLFSRYRKHRDYIADKCRSSRRPGWRDDQWEVESELWHGCGATSPAVIYEGDNGFRRNYSNDGFWGRAVYFAQNASYSADGYQHRIANGQAQLFLATVVTGMYQVRARDKSIVEPGVIPKSTLEQDRYDSIKGNTGGSDVFMVYTDYAAYPSFLVTYEPIAPQ